jgi:hypothetical protein
MVDSGPMRADDDRLAGYVTGPAAATALALARAEAARAVILVEGVVVLPVGVARASSATCFLLLSFEENGPKIIVRR